MAIRLFALDMDGTLLMNDHQSVSEKNQETIRLAMDRGAEFVPATGRMRCFIPQGVTEIPGWRYAITSNGAAVYDIPENRVLYSDYLDKELVRKILRAIAPFHVFFELYCNGESYIEKEQFDHCEKYNVLRDDLDYFLNKSNQIECADAFLEQGNCDVEKIFLPFIRQGEYDELETILSAFPVSITSSGSTNLEVNSATCNKGRALRFLSEHLGLSPKEVMAVGDNRNDLEMLAFAGCSVAMGNGEDYVKDIARYETLKNHEDGVAAALERFVLKK